MKNLAVRDVIPIPSAAEFSPLTRSLQSANYNVAFEAKIFSYQDNNIFTLENLRALFPGEDIRGSINLCKYQDVQKKIQKSLAFSEKEMGEIDNSEIILTRTKRFWQIIQKHFNLPPQIIYKHEAYAGSSFRFYVMWGFCYIFLSESKGLLIAGESYD